MFSSGGECHKRFCCAPGRFSPFRPAVKVLVVLKQACCRKLAHSTRRCRYDFVRARIPADTQRRAAWYCVPMLKHLLEEYNYVFKMDGAPLVVLSHCVW